ncbi:MAG: DUF3179 domain-containing protein [Methanobacteriota archaeon]|nr:MAG: DUF3179 domain-containing protein [Euryarchaeota archaeon]
MKKSLSRLGVFVFTFLALMIVINCSKTPSDTTPPVVKEDNERIFIVDRTGKEWDVTHAVKKYGMKAEDFQFGLGPFSITPLDHPSMISPGDPGYPGSQEDFLVIGVRLNNDVRAYPLRTMLCFEVANETIGQQEVAVAY